MGSTPSPDLGAAAAFGTLSGLSVLSDPSLKDDLSRPALALATALDQGLGQAFGLGKSLTEAGTEIVSNLVGDVASVSANVAEIVGDTIQIIPILGQLVSIVLKVMSLGLGGGKTPAQHCQEWQTLYAATPTGSLLSSSGGQPFVPADYFARIVDATGSAILDEDKADAARGTGYPSYAGIIAPSDRRFRSLLGMSLMLVTEGTLIDENDLSAGDWKTDKPPSFNPFDLPYALGLADFKKPKNDGKRIVYSSATYGKDYGALLLDPKTKKTDRARRPLALRALYRRIVSDQYEVRARAWRAGTSDFGADELAENDLERSKRGLPASWRRRFQGLRRGIESLHLKGDGGAGLWILYMDLLANAFRRGYLSRDFVRWNIVSDNNIPAACADGIADAIAQMAINWTNTIEPHYTQGKAKIEDLARPVPAPSSGPSPAVVVGVLAAAAAVGVGVYLATRKTSAIPPIDARAPWTPVIGAGLTPGGWTAAGSRSSAWRR